MKQLEEILFSQLFEDGRTLSMEDAVILSDNIKTPLDLNGESKLTDASPKRIGFATILVCIQGCLTIRLNLKDYEIRGNDVLILAPGTIGEDLHVTDDCRVCMVAFSEKAYNQPAQDKVSQVLRDFLLKDPMLLHLPQDYIEMTLAYYRQMRRLMADATFKYMEEVLRAHLTILSALFIQCLEKQPRNRQTRPEIIFNRFLQEIREHYYESRAVAFYADRLCISSKYLSHIVKSVSGRQPTDWIHDYVLLNAKAMLKSGKYSIQQVGDKLNFPNPSFFGKFFKKHVGCTPGDYQKG